MSDAFRQKVIKTLIAEIALLTGGRFEQFGYRMMDVVHPARWIESGTTVEGAPRGYTVDTSAEGGALVGEMGSASDYFHCDFKKPKDDLIHVLSLHPKVKRIWLLSSREATAGEAAKCENITMEAVSHHELLEHVEIFDARKIAGYIFDNLEVERFVSSITHYLPSIERLAEENAFSHHIPIYPDYQQRPVLEQSVCDRLVDGSCVVVSGISGIGKSALVAKVAKDLQDEFDLVIWCDARNLKTVTDLCDIDIRRSGTRHNIIGLLKRHKCLLILDDANLPDGTVANMKLAESRVIETCQATSCSDSVIVENLDRDSSLTLLKTGVSVECPDDTFQAVFSSVGGYPLLLRALNRLALEEGWDAVKSCCEDAVSSIEDERHNKVCQRILARHCEALADELEFVRWSGDSRFNSGLAAICVSTRAVSNLRKRGFLCAAVSGEIRVHDVVYSSICAVIQIDSQRERKFRDQLDVFISAECQSDRLLLHRIVNSHSSLLQRLASSDPRPAFIYGVALVRAGDTPLDLFGDPVALAKINAGYGNWTGREIEIRAVIETVEALYTLESSRLGSEAARVTLQKNIVALELLVSSSAATGEMLRDLKHHHAKMLVRLDKLQEAELEFGAILDEYPMFAAGRLQLARILNRTKQRKKAFAECKKIIAQHEDNQTPVPAPVLLEALRLLATTGKPVELEPYVEVILSSIAEVRELDKALALRLIASVAQKTWYPMPELVTRMFNSIEWHDAVPTSDFEYFDWAQAHKAAAKAQPDGHASIQEFLEAANEAYKNIQTPNDYHLTQHAEALILLKEFNEADSLLEGVLQALRKPFWFQRKSQALLGLRQADAALVAINEALRKLDDPKSIYRSAFLEDRYNARAILEDTGASDDLKQAIELLPPGDKFRKQLEMKLSKSQQSF